MFINILGLPVYLNLLFFIIGFLLYIITDQYAHLKFFNKIHLFLKNSNFFTLFIVLFILFFINFTVLNMLGINIVHNQYMSAFTESLKDIICKMSNDSDVNIHPTNVNTILAVVVDTQATVDRKIEVDAHLHLDKLHVKIYAQALNHTAAAIFSTGGTAAAVGVAKMIPDSPTRKLATGVVTALAVQGCTTVMNKILNQNSDN